MDKKQTLDMIAAISNAKGVSGFEDEVVDTMLPYAARFGDTRVDSMRNLYIRRRENTGAHPVVQLDAHSDEVGFMVQAIRPDGLLRILPLGGWVAHNVPAHKVWVRNRFGEYIPGLTASTPPHFMTAQQRSAPLEMDSICVDVGARSCEEAEALNVDLAAAVSVQEEVGSRGAAVTSQVIRPDIAIVFEGCPADDTCAPPYMVQTAIKRGPMLRHIDAKMITNPRWQRYALNLAEELGIPVQEAVRAAGSTNAAQIHLSGSGVPVIVIGVPVRYAPTHYGISAYSDFENAVRLACELLRRLDADTISGF